MNGVTTEQAREFYRAAASFYRQAPWRAVGESEAIEVRCDQIGRGPWYAVILGKKSKIKGLLLFDDLQGRRLMQRSDYDRVADQIQNISLHYEDRGQARPEDVESVRRRGYEVAGPTAYPLVFRMEAGRSFRMPVAWELELLEASLWVIPTFLTQNADRTNKVFEYAFDGTIGRMALDLSWVPSRG